MKPLLLDGAMGSVLLAQGFTPPFENLNITHPKLIQSIHQSYVHAGSEVLLTHTFSAQTTLECEAAWNNIKEFSAIKFASIGPDARAEVIVDYFKDKVENYVFETIYDLGIAQKLVEKYHHLDPIFSFCLRPADFQKALVIIAPYNLSTIGLNCLDGYSHAEELLELIPSQYQIFFKPNAGSENLTPEAFAQGMNSILDTYKIAFVGGCCGTTPQHIERVADLSYLSFA